MVEAILTNPVSLRTSCSYRKVLFWADIPTFNMYTVVAKTAVKGTMSFSHSSRANCAGWFWFFSYGAGVKFNSCDDQ